MATAHCGPDQDSGQAHAYRLYTGQGCKLEVTKTTTPMKASMDKHIMMVHIRTVTDIDVVRRPPDYK